MVTKMKNIVHLIYLLHFYLVFCSKFDGLYLPSQHLDILYSTNKKLANLCETDDQCPHKQHLGKNKCWGYENSCTNMETFNKISCRDQKQKETFYEQADFGYIKRQIDELQMICEPTLIDDSSLECTQYLRFCRGRNIFINLTSLLRREEPIRYKMDVLQEGDIGGSCKLHRKRIDEQLDHMSPLQSWAPELRNFVKLPFKLSENPQKCNMIIDKPTYIMKIDATINMYHHFCDFINLYMTQHVNNTPTRPDTFYDTFSTDVNIVIWESYPYRSPFAEAFYAFTRNKILDLNHFRGKTVCFKHVIFPLLPRMIYGLYYNTPIIEQCHNSELFRSFANHVLHRLGIEDAWKRPLTNRNVKVTFLGRDTRHRRVVNEDDLLTAAKQIESVEVQRVVFNRNIPFLSQLRLISTSTDVLIGIHGAGLTHLLFLPPWASVFELYDCEDPRCYGDLARLRGLARFTWTEPQLIVTQHQTGDDDDEQLHPGHAKFANYTFDTDEFVRTLRRAVEAVRTHPEFVGEIVNFDANLRDEL